ncbi:MAG: hypothetical protein WCS77_10525, partial [Elusimicrobiaceae bacterium]
VSPLARAGIFPEKVFSKDAAGTTAVSFIKDPAGAVFASMGMAGSAYAGPYCAFYNPAGLVGLKKTTSTVYEGPGGQRIIEVEELKKKSAASFGYDSMFESYGRSSLSFSRPFTAGVGAVSLVYASQNDLDGFDTKGTYTGSFGAYDMVAGLSWASSFRGFDWGVTFKYIHSKIENQSGSTAAMDAGIIFRNCCDKSGYVKDFAFTVRNFGLPIGIGSEKEPLPFEAGMGFLIDAKDGFYGYVDGKLPVDYSPYIAVGIEWKPFEGRQTDLDAAVRAGYNMKRMSELDGLGGWSAGGGLTVFGFTLDYAWVPMGDLGSTNRFNLKFEF